MVHLEHVTCSMGGVQALSDVTLHVERGDFVFLTGPSGAGKTTLLRVLYGDLRPKRGTAVVAGIDLMRLRPGHLPELRRKVAVVFQDFKVLGERTVFENIALALEVRGVPRASIDRRVRAVIRALNLEERSYTACAALSGGEQQRVAIARSMVVNPELILADEPTGNLDADLARHLIELFKQFNTYGTTIIMATHNREVLSWAPEARRVHLVHGRVSLPAADIVDEGAPRASDHAGDEPTEWTDRSGRTSRSDRADRTSRTNGTDEAGGERADAPGRSNRTSRFGWFGGGKGRR